jgi:hypothetical protein
MGGTRGPDETFRSASEAVPGSAPPRRRKTVKLPIVIHTEEDYDRAQQRTEELSAMPDSADKERELHALAEAMLAFELRRDEADD